LSTVRTGVGMGILFGLLMSVFLWATDSPAQAQSSDFQECQVKITSLEEQTASVTFLGQNPDKSEASLLNKLTQASLKLDADKPQDAIQKLDDFESAVTSLLAGGKISEADAATLIAGANDVIACLEEHESPTAA
jgi:FIMAH domain